MKTVKTRLLNLTAALALGAFGMGFVSAASANVMYDTSSIFGLKLASVTDANSGDVYNGWSVLAEEFPIDTNAIANGDATAAYTDSTASNSAVAMGIYDTIVQSTTSYGNANDGTAESYAFTDLEVLVNNSSLQDLTFEFDYYYVLSASVNSATWADGETALAIAGIDFLSDFDFINNLFPVNLVAEVIADPLSGPLSSALEDSGTFSFTLASGDSFGLSALNSTEGFAVGVAAVPEPSTIALLSIGLLGFGASRLRKAA